MIRFATQDDIPRIMSFIDEYWKKGHIMSRDRELFEFQHCWEDEVSFVLSEGEGCINGVLGFIPYDRSNRDVTLAIWKTLKTPETMLGVHILSFLRENGNVRTVSAPGINKKTIPVYKFLGMNTGEMIQWYRLGSSETYGIGRIADREIPGYAVLDGIRFTELDTFGDTVRFGLEGCFGKPGQLYKSLHYLERRYYRHPIYSYLHYGIRFGDEKLFVVVRKQGYKDASILRLVDCIGDTSLLKYSAPLFDGLLAKHHCSYIDCYECGVSDTVFEYGGWRKVKGSGNIIPEYFSPYEERNIDIYYMSEMENAVLFKGDGDMDRPN